MTARPSWGKEQKTETHTLHSDNAFMEDGRTLQETFAEQMVMVISIRELFVADRFIARK